MEESSQQNLLHNNFEDLTIVEEKVKKLNGESKVIYYNLGRVVSQGGLSKLHYLTNIETNNVYAVKMIQKSALTQSLRRYRVFSEIRIHKSLQHQNIVRLERVFEDDEAIYIVLELCSNQSLNDLIKRRKRLTEIEVQCYLLQIISALKYMHSRRVIHRGLRPSDTLLSDNMEIKVGDFGCATKIEFEGERKRTVCGAPNYVAPEILHGKGYSYEVDIWSLGVLTYTMLIGTPPFNKNDNKLATNIKLSRYNYPDSVPISKVAKEFIKYILNPNPAQRPTLDEILKHPFLSHKEKIPKLLPLSTLSSPPSSFFLSKFGLDIAPCGKIEPMELSSKKETGNLLPVDTNIHSTEISKGSPQTANEMEDKPFVRASTVKNLKIYMTKIIIQPGLEMKAPSVFLTKWIDDPYKEGLGYFLSDNIIGILFKDSTTFLLSLLGTRFTYVEKSNEPPVNFSLDDFPKELKKKVELLKYFQSCFGENTALTEDVKNEGVTNLREPLFVRKWKRTSSSVIFRFNNDLVQVNYDNGIEFISPTK